MPEVEYEFEVDTTSPRALQIVVYDMANNPLSKKMLRDLDKAIERLAKEHGPTLAISYVLGEQND